MTKTKTFTKVLVTAAIILTGSQMGTAQDMQGHTHSSHGPASEQTIHHGTGKLNKITEDRVVNMNHGPIQPMGMPGMRMNFKVAETVNLSAFKVGDKVAFNVIEGDNGWLVIVKMTPEDHS